MSQIAPIIIVDGETFHIRNFVNSAVLWYIPDNEIYRHSRILVGDS